MSITITSNKPISIFSQNKTFLHYGRNKGKKKASSHHPFSNFVISKSVGSRKPNLYEASSPFSNGCEGKPVRLLEDLMVLLIKGSVSTSALSQYSHHLIKKQKFSQKTLLPFHRPKTSPSALRDMSIRTARTSFFIQIKAQLYMLLVLITCRSK